MLLLLRQKISCNLSPVPAGPNSQLLRWLCVISAAGNHHFSLPEVLYTWWLEKGSSQFWPQEGNLTPLLENPSNASHQRHRFFSIKDTFRTCLIVLKLLFTNQLSVNLIYCQIKKMNTIWKTKSVQINLVLETKNSINGDRLQI